MGGGEEGGGLKQTYDKVSKKILILNKRGGGVQTNIGDRKKLKSNKPEGFKNSYLTEDGSVDKKSNCTESV